MIIEETKKTAEVRPEENISSRSDRNSSQILKTMFSRSVTSTSSTSSPKMFTSGQISDLFRRLDKDGNGALDLEEFLQIISKLNINATEEFVAKIFREVDVSKSGTLDLQAFISAYQLLYARPTKTVANLKGLKSSRKPNEFITAIRYGLENNVYMYEMYLGTVTEMDDGPLFMLSEKRIYRLRSTNNVEDLKYDIEPGFKASLDDLNGMITKDSNNNRIRKYKIMWWVDVAMKKVASHRIDKYIAGLGLPNDNKFRSNFGQFGICLNKEEKSRVYCANGISKLGGVSSLSFFVQTLWVLNTPIVHNIPSWLEKAFDSLCHPRIKEHVKKYYFSRFAFLWNASEISSAANLEYEHAFENAQLIANRVIGKGEELEYDVNARDSFTSDLLLPSKLPSEIHSKWSDPATWLLSSSELKSRPATMQFDTVSIHLLSQGCEPACCLTIREIDNEEEAKQQSSSLKRLENTSLQVESKRGVTGRLVTSIRIKMLQVLCSDGVASVNADIIDSPASIATLLMVLMNNYSMNTLGSVSMWMRLIANEVSDLAVTKHTAHTQEIATILNVLIDYVQPECEIMGRLYEECARQRSEEAIAQEIAALAELEEFDDDDDKNNLRETDLEVDEEPFDEDDQFRLKSPQTETHIHMNGRFNKRESIRKVSKAINPQSAVAASILRRISMNTALNARDASSEVTNRLSIARHRTRLQSITKFSHCILPPGTQSVPISFDVVRPFLGSDATPHFECILEGDDGLEVKGLKYWRDQVRLLQRNVEKVKEEIKVSLEEKRNLFSFILTVVTVTLAPLTILTSYWGMNFDNMDELRSDYYSFAPGVKIIWLMGVCIYTLFLMMSIHFRIIYSAT